MLKMSLCKEDYCGSYKHDNLKNDTYFEYDGYDKYGLDSRFFCRKGFYIGKPGSLYDKDGYNKDGYDKDGYNKVGYNKRGYQNEGYNKKEYYNEEFYKYQNSLFDFWSKSKTQKQKEKCEFIKKFVNYIVERYTNEKDEITEKNSYKLYSDGTVINKDNEIIMDVIVKPDSFFRFPNKGWYNDNDNNNNGSYTVLSYDNCKKIRAIIDDLLLQI